MRWSKATEGLPTWKARWGTDRYGDTVWVVVLLAYGNKRASYYKLYDEWFSQVPEAGWDRMNTIVDLRRRRRV
jgi:hypothetical protein